MKLKRPEFLMIYTDLLEDSRISLQAKILHAHLYYWREDGYFSHQNKDLVDYFSKNKSTIQKWTRELEQAGYIRKEIIRKDGRVIKRKIYVGVFRTPKMEDEFSGGTQCHQGGGTQRHGNNKYNYPSDNNTNYKRKEQSLLDVPPQIDIIDEFDKVWDLYQFKKGRENAIKAFKKLSKAERALVLKTIPAYVASTTNGKNSSAEFKPMRAMLSTWLNGKRWQDEQVSQEPDTSTSEYTPKPGEPGWVEAQKKKIRLKEIEQSKKDGTFTPRGRCGEKFLAKQKRRSK